MCVPTELLNEAEKWVNAINNRYGIIEYSNKNILILKTASFLHKFKSEKLANKIMMRVCSENINLIGKLLLNKNS